MTNPYGVVLDDESLRWAAAESPKVDPEVLGTVDAGENCPGSSARSN